MLSWEPDQPPTPQPAHEAESGQQVPEGYGICQGKPASDAVTWPTRLAINLVQTQSMKARNPSTATVQPARSESEGVIQRRVRRRSTPLTYLPHASEAIREDELLARLWGCQPASAHQRKQRLPEQLRDVIAVRRQLGKTESLASYLLPVEDALAHPMREAIQAERCADLADAGEDLAQAEYRANPCAETARALLRKRAADRMAALDHDREIAVRHGLEL